MSRNPMTMEKPDPSPLTLSVRLNGRNCLVVGGGSVGSRRVSTLLKSGANVSVVSPSVSETITSAFEIGQLRWHSRKWSVEDCDGMFLVVAATDDDAVNAAISEECRRFGILCNNAADAEDGDVLFPVAHSKASVTVTASGGDAGPVFSRMLLDHLTDNLDESWVALAQLAGEMRQHLRQVLPTSAQRGKAMKSILQSDVVHQLVRENRINEAREEALKCISTL